FAGCSLFSSRLTLFSALAEVGELVRTCFFSTGFTLRGGVERISSSESSSFFTSLVLLRSLPATRRLLRLVGGGLDVVSAVSSRALTTLRGADEVAGSIIESASEAVALLRCLILALELVDRRRFFF